MAKLQSSTLTSILQKWLNFFAPVLLLLAVMWLCWNLARVLWVFLAPPVVPNLPPVARQMSAPQTGNRIDFVIFQQPQAVADPIDNEPPPPPVDMKINGVMVSNNSSQSSAMIEVNGKVQSYRVGEEIDDSPYRLQAVNWDKVVIVDDQGNQSDIVVKEKFSLDQEANLDKQAGSGTFGSIGNEAPPMDNTPPMDEPPQAPIDRENGEDPQAIGQLSIPPKKVDNPTAPNTNPVNKAMDSIKKDPQKFLNRMGVTGGGNGYVVSDDMPTKVRQKMGLQMGDVVLSVNGNKLTGNIELDSGLLSSVKRSKNAEIKIKRGEQIITLRQQFK